MTFFLVASLQKTLVHWGQFVLCQQLLVYEAQNFVVTLHWFHRLTALLHLCVATHSIGILDKAAFTLKQGPTLSGNDTH